MNNVALAAVATSTASVPGVVTERKSLWNGIVRIKVPANARYFNINIGGEQIKYLRFPRLVPGGVVNLHLHGDKPETYRSRNIVAKAEVFCKRHEDGREFLYVDLHPQEGMQVTHRLGVMSNDGNPRWPEGSTVFETPGPLNGAIVITSPDGKMA